MVKYALISTTDKQNLAEFTQCLVRCGYTLLASGTTLAYLQKNNIPAQSVSTITKIPEMIGGRVKTLHPAIHAGILAKRDGGDIDEITKMNYVPIDIVVVNFYQFSRYLEENPKATYDEAIEYMDIGGPAMVRSAIKNSKYVTVITSPLSYPRVQKQLLAQDGIISKELRKELALEAAYLVYEYDKALLEYLLKINKNHGMRYGENPHQDQAYFIKQVPAEFDFFLHQGKQLSYNNYLDFDTIIKGLSFLKTKKYFCIIVKHGTPCTAAIADNATTSYLEAFNQDRESSFGGIIGINQEIDEKCACAILSNQFCELVIAPKFSSEAIAQFSTKPNIRIIEYNNLNTSTMESRSSVGGTLFQTKDLIEENELHYQSIKNDVDRDNINLAWAVCSLAKSNAIAIVSQQHVIALASGFTSRVAAVKYALAVMEEKEKMRESNDECYLATDGFFPFSDSIELIANHPNIKTIIRPTGSIRDSEVDSAAKKYNIRQILSIKRHFRH